MPRSSRRLAVIYLTEWNSAVRAIRRMEKDIEQLYHLLGEMSEEDVPDLED